MTYTPEWVSAIASSISALGIILIVIQILLSYLQIKKDHERSRREFTIGLMKDWTLNLSHSSSAARKLAESFDIAQCKAVYNHQTLKLPKEANEKIISVLQDVLVDDEKLDEEGDQIILKEKHVAHLKFLLITYLNTLETILMAWKLSVADKNILEHEFSYLVKPEEGHEALSVFRQAVGGKNCYPAIHDFVATLKSKSENSGPENRKAIA